MKRLKFRFAASHYLYLSPWTKFSHAENGVMTIKQFEFDWLFFYFSIRRLKVKKVKS